MSTESTPKLTDFKVIIFDVYGTLADWETGIYDALKPLLAKFPKVKWGMSEANAAFHSVAVDLQARYPSMLYTESLAKCHSILEERLKALSGKDSSASTSEGDPNIPDTQASSFSSDPVTSASTNAHLQFAQCVKSFPVFPDTTEALHRLTKHYKLTVLSNVDHDLFGGTHAKLSEGNDASFSATYGYPDPNPNKYWFPQEISGSKSPFTMILTAEDTKVYKPALEGFHIALDCIQKDPRLLNNPTGNDAKEKTLSVAQSLFHDHSPANQLGMKSVWIDRSNSVSGEAPNIKYTWRFETLGQMADAVDRELSEKK